MFSVARKLSLSEKVPIFYSKQQTLYENYIVISSIIIFDLLVVKIKAWLKKMNFKLEIKLLKL
jgi:hypothetical protein